MSFHTGISKYTPDVGEDDDDAGDDKLDDEAHNGVGQPGVGIPPVLT